MKDSITFHIRHGPSSSRNKSDEEKKIDLSHVAMDEAIGFTSLPFYCWRRVKANFSIRATRSWSARTGNERKPSSSISSAAIPFSTIEDETQRRTKSGHPSSFLASMPLLLAGYQVLSASRSGMRIRWLLCFCSRSVLIFLGSLCASTVHNSLRPRWQFSISVFYRIERSAESQLS